jgi:hypothetical protein
MSLQYDRAMETDVDEPPYTAILAMALLGRRDEAAARLRAAEQAPMPRLLTLWVTTTRAAIEGRLDEAARAGEELFATWLPRDPCAIYYAARTVAAFDPARALEMFRLSVEGGYYCADFFARDPWMDPVRSERGFAEVLELARRRNADARDAFIAARGEQILGTIR